MKKKLNEAAVVSELRQGSAFFRDATRAEDTEATAAPPTLAPSPPDLPTGTPTGTAVGQPTSRPIGRRTGPSTSPMPEPGAAPPFDQSVILGRPKAFYITEQQDQDLDVAVGLLAARLKGRGNQKIDRSTVIRLLLEVSDLTAEATADRLASHFVRRLVSQLTG